jgi:hypothetical protein
MIERMAKRIPRVTAGQLAGADMIAEQALHRALYQVEDGNETHIVDRLPLLIVVWNRCSDQERTQFLALLRDRSVATP